MIGAATLYSGNIDFETLDWQL